MLKSFTLKNGLKVATYNLPNLKSVHLLIAAKGGSLTQGKEENGVAHFMEHMLAQGIPTFPTVEAFSGFIEGLAGHYGAFTQPLLVGFEITTPFSYLEKAVQITSEVFFQPLFPADVLEKERRVIISEIKQRMDSKYYKINKFFQSERFSSSHILAQDVGGDISEIEKFKREDLISFWQKFFTPQNTYLIVVGNFSSIKLDKQIKKYFENITNNKVFPGYQKMSEKDFSNTKVAIRHDPSLGNDYLDITFPAMKLSDPLELRMQQSLALAILGRLRNSRLFKLLRYQKGLVYDVRASLSMLPDLGYVSITSETLPENLEEVVRLILQELKGFVQNGPTEDELKFAKNFIIAGWQMAFDHPSSIAGWLEGELIWEKDVTLPEDHAKKIEDISVADITAMMQKYWDFNKLQLAIQGPTKKTKHSLAKYERIVKELGLKYRT